MKEKTGSKLTELSDLELIDKARKQDQMAFVILYQRYYGALSAHVSKFISNREELEDVCIESFQKAFSRIDTYKEDYMFSTWLFRIGQNTAFDHLSKNDREKTNLPTTSINEDFAELKDIPATMHNPEEDIINQQEYDKWLNNIEKLKDDYRVVAKMNLIDNFGYKEIAEALDMPLNTVKTKIRRAKNQLLKMMEYSDELL